MVLKNSQFFYNYLVNLAVEQRTQLFFNKKSFLSVWITSIEILSYDVAVFRHLLFKLCYVALNFILISPDQSLKNNLIGESKLLILFSLKK